MREHKALRVALSTILSVSMVMGSVPTAAIAEVLDEDIPPVVEVVEEGAPEEAGPAEETAPANELVATEPTADPDESINLMDEVAPTTVTATEDTGEDDLLGRYVEQLFDEAMSGSEDDHVITAQMVALTGVSATVFDLLGPMIVEVADGTRPSSVFEIPLEQVTDKLTFTAEELGVESLIVDGKINEAASDAAYATVEPDVDKLLDHLVATYPYELYWFDKTHGVTVGGYGCNVSGSGEEYVLTLKGSLTFEFAVASSYAAGENVVDASQAARAQKAAVKAQQIASQGASSSPYDRLKLFNDTICSMASYNDTAAAGGVDSGDPWQLVYVFDGDDSTKVVCEGYSKAFKYLCDLASVPNVTCSTMSGTMTGGTGAGRHMWDVVNMDDGKNYLVDVTNCDQGTVGNPHQLFIVPFSSGSVSDGYVFDTENKSITYEYDAEMSQLYTNTELTISATAYDPSQHSADVAAAQAVDDMIAEISQVEQLTLDDAGKVAAVRAAYNALTEAQKPLVTNYGVLTAAEAKIASIHTIHVPLTGAVVEVTSEVYNSKAQMPQVTVILDGAQLAEGTDFTVDAGTYINAGSYQVTITGTGRYEGSAEGLFTITPRSISAATVSAIPAQTWNGKAIEPEPTVKDGAKELVKGDDYTVAYSNNVNPGTATVTVTGRGNYTGTKAATFSITKPISSATVSAIGAQAWTGKAITPQPTIRDGATTLRSGTDYTLSYSNNTNPGTATVTVTGKGFYTGTKRVTFKVGPKTGEWRKSGSKWWYRYTDGTYPKSQFADIDGGSYYFDANGWMVTGWKKIGAAWYYFRSDGRMGANDWAKSGSKWCFLRADGTMATGWVEVSGKRYYMDASGCMVTGWRQVSGKWYYFEGSGAMARNKWVQSGSRWCYLGSDGTMATGWKTISGKTYWMDASGYMVTGWKQISGKYYYFESSGAMARSKWVGNYWLGPDGVMATNAWVDGGKYYVGADGAWVKGKTK